MHARLVVAILLAYGCTTEVTPTDPPRSNTIELGNGDRIVIEADGRHTYVGADGSTHTLLAQPRGSTSGAPMHIDIVSSGGGSTSPCADVTVPVNASRSTVWDLQGVFAGSGENLMSPVDNQGNRAACWAFAQVSQIEMEYVRQFSLAHDAATTAAFAQTMLLSKEYYLAMTSLETGGPTFSEFASVPAKQVPAGRFAYPQSAVADMTDLNQTCGGQPLIGLPLEADWPYIQRDMEGVYPMMQSDPLSGGTNVIGATDSQTFMDQFVIGGGGPYDGTALLVSNNLSYAFNLDLANFYWQPDGAPTNSAYPPPAVHEDARYAPLAVQFMSGFIADAWTTSPFLSGVKVPSWPLSLYGCGKQTLVDYPIVKSGVTPSADQISCLNALAAPYETLLAQNHPIVITTRPNNWFYDNFLIDATNSGPSYVASYWNNFTTTSNTTEVVRFSNNISGDSDTTQHYWPLINDPNADQHFVTLIGYDHEHQWFHFKNEWGTNYGTGQGTTGKTDGTFWITYDMLFRTQFTEPEYINGVSDPLLALSDPTNPAPVPAPIPNGNWFGFWQGTVGGVPGVAIVGHFSNDTRGTDLIQGTSSGQSGNPAGTFYPSDGSASTDFQMTSWWSTPTTYTATFADTTAAASALFTLTATFGASTPSAQFIDTHGVSATWFKCSSAMTEAAGKFIGTMTLVPQTYLDTLSDPYVLPPCTAMPWHVTPTWGCNAGDTYFEYDGYDVGYSSTFMPYAPNQDEIKRLCVRPSATAPSCPATYVLKPDLFNTNVDNALLTFTQSLDGCVAGSDATCLACDTSTATCDIKCNKKIYAPPTCPTPSGLTATSRMPLLGAFAGPEGDGRPDELWELPQLGLDVCVAGNYPAIATCPSGYHLSPNGTDCVPIVLPPHPPPPPPGQPT